MPYFLTKTINIPLGQDVNGVKNRLAKLLHINAHDMQSFWLHKQSIDARDKSNVHFVCSYVVETDKLPRNTTPYTLPDDVLLSAQSQITDKHCIIVGAGPAGLFSALYLAKNGVQVTVIEKGSDVEKRQSKVKSFFDGGSFDPQCNVQFGLGGAGTFSDGKLTTGISSPLTYTVFNQFVRSGAPKDILTSALPHVGTDKLVDVVARLRDEITSYGGQFMFDTEVMDFVVVDGQVVGVKLDNGNILYADDILLACGHSARNVFYRLDELGAGVIFKPFAVGLRIEHGREFINNAQYGALFATHRDLPTASYKLVHNGTAHSCYSFCMCPGGVVVAANSNIDTVVVNGMSNYLRNDANSNSALVVNVTADDVKSYGFGDGPFAGIRFQQYLEQKAYELGGGNYLAPCQNVVDFVADKPTVNFDVTPSYPRGVTPANLRELLPETIVKAMCDALAVFDNKIKGFGSSGVLTGVESRTSSPVKILRDETYQSNLKNLYPIGEGAGYAGGIVSSAVDGLKVAMSIVQRFKNDN